MNKHIGFLIERVRGLIKDLVYGGDYHRCPDCGHSEEFLVKSSILGKPQKLRCRFCDLSWVFTVQKGGNGNFRIIQNQDWDAMLLWFKSRPGR